MKHALLILALLLMASTAWGSPFLGSDPHPAPIVPTQVQVEITPQGGSATVVAGTYNVVGPDVQLYDLNGLTPNKYTFRVRWADGTGWWSEWSLPFVAGKPNAVGGLRVIQ